MELDHTTASCADPSTTLVVYMGLSTLPALTRQLTAAGLPPGTPAVAVERGTTIHQRTVFSPLDHLCDDVATAGLKSPTLIMIGDVVRLAPGWCPSGVVQEGSGLQQQLVKQAELAASGTTYNKLCL